ncbi:stage III sporulation protein AD [Clostridium massiliamazoniense]|uniref:stage III sporulation protein AD n=1 Tax=Clostridium massiliamazoniense TaxID=1347366 RepID=UPI0006D7AD9F|nr:stage III sporulation protein AD [Clostridium massiliamazoniense]
MDILKIVAFALVVLFFYMFLKEHKQSFAVNILIVAGIMIFIFMVPKISEVLGFVREIATDSGVDIAYIEIVLKILGISYLASFCSELCKDAGAGSLAAKVEFSGKIMILILAIPILMAVLNSILKIM